MDKIKLSPRDKTNFLNTAIGGAGYAQTQILSDIWDMLGWVVFSQFAILVAMIAILINVAG